DGFADLPPGLDGDDDEPIALSADELDNIMGDVEGGDAFGTDTTATDESLSTDLDEEPLPDLELDDIPDTSFDGMGVDGLDQEMDEPVIDAAPDMDSDEDDNITLTDDELSKVLLDTDESTEADASAAEDWSGTEEEIPDSPPLSSLEMDDDEPIALTPEELGNIVSEVDVEEPGAADEEPVSALDEFEAVEEFNTPDDFDAPVESAAESQEYETAEEYETAAFSGEGWDDDDDQVALSDDELGSILEDVDQGPEGASPEFSPGAEVSEGFDETFDTALSEEADAGSADDNQTDIINLDEYEEEAIGYQNESDAATAEATEVEQTERSAAVDKIASEEGLDRTELKKMIGYLDQLFDQLPENTIREFSRSEYFDLYKKIMTDLGM
ncbi:MAG: hypothetical protein KDK30_05050, partial [Leptospiraceae bacterium]|nr:hypothetical protein [Leptospiraceae bacterium]